MEKPKLMDYCLTLFKEADADCNGSITVTEFKEMFNKLTTDYPQLGEYR